MPNPVVHFEINGQDGKKLQSFYKSVFEWKIEDTPMPQGSYGMVAAQGSGIGGGISASEGPSHVTFYIEVDDTDAYLKKVNAAGGRTIMPTTTIPNMVTFALFADPEGHTVGLVKAEPAR